MPCSFPSTPASGSPATPALMCPAPKPPHHLVPSGPSHLQGLELPWLSEGTQKRAGARSGQGGRRTEGSFCPNSGLRALGPRHQPVLFCKAGLGPRTCLEFSGGGRGWGGVVTRPAVAPASGSLGWEPGFDSHLEPQRVRQGGPEGCRPSAQRGWGHGLMAWPGTCGDPEEGRRGASPVGSPPPAPSRVLVPPGAGEGWSGLSLGPLPAEAALPWPGLGVGGRGCFSKVLSSSPLRIGGGSKGRGHPPERLPEGLQTCGPQVSPGPVVVPTAQRLQHLCPDPQRGAPAGPRTRTPVMHGSLTHFISPAVLCVCDRKATLGSRGAPGQGHGGWEVMGWPVPWGPTRAWSWARVHCRFRATAGSDGPLASPPHGVWRGALLGRQSGQEWGIF